MECVPHYYNNSSQRAQRPVQDACIGEEVKMAIHLALEKFKTNESLKELELPSSLTASERAYTHKLCEELGIKSKSRGKNNNRHMTITKKIFCQHVQEITTLKLEKSSQQQIQNLIQKYPLSNKERQDLLPKADKFLDDDVGKDFMKTTVGRLNNGVPQIPPKQGDSSMKAFQELLPIYQKQNEILQVLEDNVVALIAGGTGSGKTTQVPQMILDNCQKQRKSCRIFCSQPRRLAALTTAERVANERGEKIGQTVGYQIRLESKVSPRTLLTFCTNGVLLRTLMGGDSALGMVTHIIVDEVHERDRYSDILLTALRDLLPKYKNLKVILMSAAFNVKLFVNYFHSCPVVTVPGSLFEVQEFFLEDTLKWTGCTTETMTNYKKGFAKMEKQQLLSKWCNEQLPVGGKDVDIEYQRMHCKPKYEDTTEKETELVKPEKELNQCYTREMDKLLSEAWLTGNEDVFHEIFHLIINENINVDYMHSETSATALMIAAGRGFTDIVENLLNFGADINVRAFNNWSALDWAKKFERNNIVKLFESHHASGDFGNVVNKCILLKSAQAMQTGSRELYIYDHYFDEDVLNTDLIVCLLHKILAASNEGAILIFLPSYNEIVILRDKISEDKRFENVRYCLFTLHSLMQSHDQKRVFKTPPAGVRKIILSTDIAESSLTINDVVYVIDTGKIKEKTFDAITSATMLKTSRISRASSLQRKERAGRCASGTCYHLFSRHRYDTMQQYQDPEIIRYPLQELCLQIKLLVPNCSVAEFLSKCPQSPPFLNIRNATQLLKKIDAFDPMEDLTEMGHHLADLPIEPSLGKMVLCAVVLKCLDPVLTIVCALAHKDPFIIPAQTHQKKDAAQARRKFSAGTYSDHMSFLRAFQAWQKARTEGWEKSFCEKNYLSAACMEMIVGMRAQLLGQLRASGFVRARGGGDIRDLNVNSEKWTVVKAALCAGHYPNLIRVGRDEFRLITQKETKLKMHNASVLSSTGIDDNGNGASLRDVMNRLPSEWLMYEEVAQMNHLAIARCCTLVSSITVVLFTGPAKLSAEIIKEAEGLHHDEGKDFSQDKSDSGEDSEDRNSVLQIDEWISFEAEPVIISLILLLRQKWHSLFIRRMRYPSKPWSQIDETVVRAIVEVLGAEERELGLQQPTGIGQRPKPMLAESIMSSSVYGNGVYEFNDFCGFDKTASKGVNRAGVSSVSNKTDLSAAGKSLVDDKSDNSPVVTSDSLPESVSQEVSPFKMGRTVGYHCHFFIMKCNSQRNLEISLNKGIWATTPNNERKLNKAYEEGKTLFLIFSVQGSGHFQGYAKMVSFIGKDKSSDFNSPGLSGTFKIDWVKRGNVSFQSTYHLSNSWNDNKKIQVSRDGQEIEPSVGEKLLKLWNKFPNFYGNLTTRSSSSSSSSSTSSSSNEKNIQSKISEFVDQECRKEDESDSKIQAVSALTSSRQTVFNKDSTSTHIVSTNHGHWHQPGAKYQALIPSHTTTGHFLGGGTCMMTGSQNPNYQLYIGQAGVVSSAKHCTSPIMILQRQTSNSGTEHAQSSPASSSIAVHHDYKAN